MSINHALCIDRKPGTKIVHGFSPAELHRQSYQAAKQDHDKEIQTASLHFIALNKKRHLSASNAIMTSFLSDPASRFIDQSSQKISNLNGFNQLLIYAIDPMRLAASVLSLIRPTESHVDHPRLLPKSRSHAATKAGNPSPESHRFNSRPDHPGSSSERP